MADMKISGLTALTGANTATGDLLEIVDVSDTTMAATGTNKKITLTELMGAGTVPGTFTTLTSTGNAALGDAAATDTHAIKGATTLLVNSASAALTITQTHLTGNAFVVEDSASTDSTPFVIDASGNVVQGAFTYTLGSTVAPYYALVGSAAYGPQFVLQNKVVDASSSYFVFRKDRAGSVVASGDSVGVHTWNAFDGTNFIAAAQILAAVDGTPGTNDMPGRLVFSTTAGGASSPTERMRINSYGNIFLLVDVGIEARASLQVSKNITGGTSSWGVYSGGTVQSDVTASAYLFSSAGRTAAAAFTLANLNHFFADTQTVGATSAITSQFGFAANSSLTGATSNYGFYGNIASAANRYNFYAAGTADNVFKGNVRCGGTSSVAAPTVALDVTGAILASTTITATTGFGCNSKSAQTAVTVNAASTDLATVVALCNQLRAALIANGICA